ncbi:saccharopine dehydrogenase NADP-binding domain-containing protein [Pedobacter gandavensis]|uniref:saccharopine dehydrogenase NADP-binding domain-containing protein n=1 Tax=Pedobacter gandavensis TaxID=2679963 RepID=UPI002479BCA2|nr:saccharopine dehydrogenase NADP-binding domain-containing protein [Pedobacter gandavensis]WGQ10770.1 saccharopine dehydrogenase NADP-binding domain-containing protein [Pedobacter gandavensis]
MNKSKKMLLYGAAGYTGKIIAARAKELNLDFEIAGREADKIKDLAAELNVRYHVFTVGDGEAWRLALRDKKVLINAAGPFQHTAKQAIDACLRAGVHYLDISAELETYQLAESLDNEAKDAGIQLISGAGLFLSYDALVVHLAKQVSQPISLKAGFRHFGGFSRGSVLSSKNIADLGSLIRKDSVLIQGDNQDSKVFAFGTEDVECMPTALGGVILSYKSTGIPNIEEYFSLKLPATQLTDLNRAHLPDGPTEAERAAGRNGISAEVTGKDAKVVKAYIDAPSGYNLTPLSVVAVVNRILNDDYKTGYQSPGSAYGESIIGDIPDTHLHTIQS